MVSHCWLTAKLAEGIARAVSGGAAKTEMTDPDADSLMGTAIPVDVFAMDVLAMVGPEPDALAWPDMDWTVALALLP